MSLELRITLIVVSLFAFIFCLRMIRKSSMKIDDAVFWFFVAGLIFLFALFPGIPISISKALKVESPVNFVYLAVIFLLLYKVFMQTLKISSLQTKIEVLVQEMAIRENLSQQHSSDNTED